MASPFAPSTITRSTLSKLLSLYPTTVKSVYRAKLLAKTNKKSKAPASRGKKQEATVPAEPDHRVEKDVDEFFELDTWRFETLPMILCERLKEGFEEGGDDGDGERPAKRAKRSHGTKGTKEIAGKNTSDFFLERDEIVRLMEWKLKHGTFRPALLGLIQSNAEEAVKSTTSASFNALPSPSSKDSFPSESLQVLSDALRGVGPATASLILSALPSPSNPASDQDSSDGIPFFSDELFVWLCLGVYPDSGSEDHSSSFRSAKRGIKYNVKEYRQLFEAVNEFRARVQNSSHADKGSGGPEKVFSTLDVEKIAFVIGHIDASGYEGVGEPEVEAEAQKADNSEEAQVTSSNKEKEVMEEVELEKRRTRSGTRRQSKK